jgi:hypothetical protein
MLNRWGGILPAITFPNYSTTTIPAKNQPLPPLHLLKNRGEFRENFRKYFNPSSNTKHVGLK